MVGVCVWGGGVVCHWVASEVSQAGWVGGSEGVWAWQQGARGMWMVACRWVVPPALQPRRHCPQWSSATSTGGVGLRCVGDRGELSLGVRGGFKVQQAKRMGNCIWRTASCGGMMRYEGWGNSHGGAIPLDRKVALKLWVLCGASHNPQEGDSRGGVSNCHPKGMCRSHAG